MNVQPPTTPTAYSGTQDTSRQDAISVAVRTAQTQQAPASAPHVAPLDAVEESQKTDPKDVRDAIQRVKEFIAPLSSQLEFSVDKDSGSRIVRVVDQETGETIRQIPSKEMLQIASALERLQGLLVREKA